MTNTIPNVPRKLLERCCKRMYDMMQGDLHEELRAILSTPSPAGEDWCKCSMSISMLGDGCRYCQPQEYIDRLGEMLDEERAELSDAQATIDGLRGEVAQLQSMLATVSKAGIRVRTDRDQQAQRIAELEGLLREVHDTYRAAIHWEDLRGTMKRINAAPPASKDADK